MNRSSARLAYPALWALVALALVAAFVVWGVRIDSSLSAVPEAVPTPTPTATALPLVATIYSDSNLVATSDSNPNLGPPDPRTLCAELSPEPKEVTVESNTGVVIATIQCRR